MWRRQKFPGGVFPPLARLSGFFMVNLTSEQQAAAYAKGSVVVTAGAGTGKTLMLAERYLYYLREKQLSPLNLVAVTFTEKAALELRSRIRSRVMEELPERIDILAELEVAQISTIHALANRICQEHFKIAGVPADFQVLDELEGTLWLSQALETAIHQLDCQIYHVIPYSILVKILDVLLSDPLTAERAFNQELDWGLLVQDLRQTALKELIEHSIWQESREILQQYQGKADDKLEKIRQGTVEAILRLEENHLNSQVNYLESLAVLDQIKINVGVKKNWQGESIDLVKEALKALREQVRSYLKVGLINLTLTEADEQLKRILPSLKKAYQQTYNFLSQSKYKSRILTFTDLEVYGLQAVQHPDVKRYYQNRWQVFLVDEFQDTNPIQGELITALTETAELTIVGDKKQSIYGFRRANIRVFDQFRNRILKNNGTEVILSQSFRTHHILAHQLNQICSPLLGSLHQPLTAFRSSQLNEKSYIQVFTVSKTNNTNKLQRQQIEAQQIAEVLQNFLESKTEIFDKSSNQYRPVQPGDMAILTKTWEPLELYGDALMSRGIPVASAKGGNLLETREAKDAWALLRFLADPKDNIALVAILRSPFFAISDRLLFQIANQSESREQEQNFLRGWELINYKNFPELTYPIQVLKQLLSKRDQEPPSRLLQRVDYLTGYTAVIANLPNGTRRQADWQKFRELVQQLEQGVEDLFGVVRRLKRLMETNVEVPRLPLEAGNAVSLMTIHAAKGLEWPVVVVADLTRQRSSVSSTVEFDTDYGVALPLKPQLETVENPVLYIYLEQLRKQRENTEALRVLYVGLTRARDFLILTATDELGTNLECLRQGLEAANLPIITLDFDQEKALPPISAVIPQVQHFPPLLIHSVGSGLFELPVTALTEYSRCPKQFEFRYVEGHPGIGQKGTEAMQVGRLVHAALQHNIRQVEDLTAFAEASWRSEVVEEAIALVKRFDQVPEFVALRERASGTEYPITLTVGQLKLNGVIDGFGNNWILDYKTDQNMHPQEHRFQLWAYATALGYSNAYIAYLRHDFLYHFKPDELRETNQQVEVLIQEIKRGNYTPHPSKTNCYGCFYAAICTFSMTKY